MWYLESLPFNGIVTRTDKISTWVSANFHAQAIKKGQPIYRGHETGHTKMTGEEIKTFDSGVSLIHRDVTKKSSLYGSENAIYQFEEGKENYSSFSIITTDKALVERFEDIKFEKDSAQNVVNVIISNNGRYTIRPLGTLESPLKKDNYCSDTINSFDYTIRELHKRTPSGRLVIIHGLPGSGKTFFVKGLINELDDHNILLMDAKLVSELGGPELLNVFISHRESCSHPILLILEDADACLLPRDTMNMSHISSLLNSSDGILGDLLDMRVIVTTNAKHIEIDKALLRPGRLLTQIHIGEVSREMCQKIFKRLKGTEDWPGKFPCTLADIYHRAGISQESDFKVSMSKETLTEVTESGIGFRGAYGSD